MRNVAVILAGGRGNRFGADKPKQFLEMPDGRTILEHSVEAFARCEEVDEVCIVCREDWCEYVRSFFCESSVNARCEYWAKIKHIIPGGKERYHSTLAALKAYEGEDDVVFLIHDAVRPYISRDVIVRCVEKMRTAEACAVGVHTTDTIWVTEGNRIKAIPERKTLFNAQTPQCFRAETLQNAFAKAMQDPEFLPTDDCGVVLTYCPDVAIEIVEGEPGNIKITFAGDIH